MANNRLKIPKEYKATARSMYDPLGVDPFADKIFGAKKGGPDYSAEEAAQQKAIDEQNAAINEFSEGGPAVYSAGDALGYDTLGDSKMGNITTDPKYKEYELAALKDLEDQSKSGFTASDRADMARVEAEANRANRGRMGAIQQNMQARGMSGSGMDLVAQMQSAQDSNEMEALKALEQEGMMQSRKQDASARLGSLSGQLQGRDFEQEAAKARAADDIARFNNQTVNSGKLQNWDRQNSTSDKNSGAKYDFSQDKMRAKVGQAEGNFDWAVDKQNRKMFADQEAERKAAGAMGMAGTIGGAVIGGVVGKSPQAAQAGAQVGGSAGYQAGGNNYRNQQAYRSDENCKENIHNEHPLEIEAFLDSLSPKSFDYKEGEKGKHGVIAQDLEKSNIGRSLVEEDEEGMKNIKIPDAIAALFEAVSHLNKKTKG